MNRNLSRPIIAENNLNKQIEEGAKKGPQVCNLYASRSSRYLAIQILIFSAFHVSGSPQVYRSPGFTGKAQCMN